MSADFAKARRVLIPLAFVNFTVGVGAFVPISLLAPLSQSLSLSKAQAGWVMGVYALAYAVSSPILVSISGGLRRRSVILTGLALFVAGGLATAFVRDASALFAVRIAAAIGAFDREAPAPRPTRASCARER